MLAMTSPKVVAGSAHLPAFASEAELQAYVGELKAAEERERRERLLRNQAAPKIPGNVEPISVNSVESTTILTAEQIAKIPVAKNITSVALLAPGTVSAPASAGDGITNVQTAGVDEGGIVKKLGDFLIVLRRGRLFTIRATDADLRPVATINAYGPGISPAQTWYDEMLVSDRTIVVIGYSYHRDGTELSVFRIDPDGNLSYLATHQLRSSDYYSTDNYASRLIGNTLVFYSPMQLVDDLDASTPEISTPAIRHWRAPGKSDDFERILPATSICRSDLDTDRDPTLHSVTRCQLSESGGLDCLATAVLGAWGGTFYVSADAVYIWTSESIYDQPRGRRPRAAVLRMPLDGSAPSSLQVAGNPVDQLSFLEQEGHLNVLVGDDGDAGNRMWSGTSPRGSLALLRVPVSAFGDSRARARRGDFRNLPEAIPGIEGRTHNRYVGDWLLFGNSAANDLYAVRYARRTAPVQRRVVGHVIERIEALGDDALAVGNAKDDLVFTSLGLGAGVRIASRFVQPGSSQSESRTHGFFYRSLGPGVGLLGLPIVGEGPAAPAAVKFLSNKALALGDLGQLGSRGGVPPDDGCEASCVDWYGDARPIFIEDRVYALMGYELVEGALVDGRIRERRRVDYSPKPVSRARRKD